MHKFVHARVILLIGFKQLKVVIEYLADASFN